MVRSLAFLVGAALLSAAPVNAQQARSVMPLVELGETLLLVEAEGSTTVKPELMGIEFEVVSTGDTAEAALASNNADMTRVIEAIKQFEMEPDGLRTSEFGLGPQFPNDRRSGDRTEIIGYKANNSVKVLTSELDKAGAMIAAAFEAGANSVSGPGFDVREETAESAIRIAERDALSSARAQADNIASALDMQVSRVLRVSDRRVDFDRGYDRGSFIVVTGSRIQPTPLEVGTLPVSVELFVEYALVPK